MTDSATHRRPDLAVLVSELGKGGMGKMRIQLINALVARGLTVDLLFAKELSEYSTADLDPRVRVVRLRTTNALTGVPQLAAYLRRSRPTALLTQRIRVNILAHRARAVARVPVRVYATINTHVSRALENRSERERRARLGKIRRYFPRNDGLIGVSRGVADDFADLLGWPRESIDVAPNPVIKPELDELAAAPVDHPWFQPGEPPVVLGVGRLTTQKYFPDLIRAFARLRERHEARLVILGKGPRRDEIEAAARDAGIEADFDLPGFVANPYAYMARSRMFVLSSGWEGSPNVLVEAMAVGTAVVATDCPSGPREILEGGRLAPLVPVGDPEALAEAMERVWNDPPDPEVLRASARERYSPDRSAEAFMRAMGLAG
ncbi:MAG TPA: glycosyltransferase [Gammaproteobacteria bacterium]|nr:glycosyltransferase [Gammaproteobacteria bacterium]